MTGTSSSSSNSHSPFQAGIDEVENMDDEFSEYENLSRSLFQVISREDLSNSQQDISQASSDESQTESTSSAAYRDNNDDLNSSESHTGFLPRQLGMSWTFSEDTSSSSSSSSSAQGSSSSVDIPSSYITLVSQADTESLLSNANSDVASDEGQSQISTTDSSGRSHSFHDIMDQTPSFILSDVNNASSSSPGNSSILTENATLNEFLDGGEGSSITLKMPLIDLCHIQDSHNQRSEANDLISQCYSNAFSINKRYTFQDIIPARKLSTHSNSSHDYSRYLFMPPRNQKWESTTPLNVWLIGNVYDVKNKILSKLHSSMHSSSCPSIETCLSAKYISKDDAFEFAFQEGNIVKFYPQKKNSPTGDTPLNKDLPDLLIVFADIASIRDPLNNSWKVALECANSCSLPTMIIVPELADSFLFSTEIRLPEDYLFPHYCLLQRESGLDSSLNFHRQLANPHGRLIPIDVDSFMTFDDSLLNSALSINCSNWMQHKAGSSSLRSLDLPIEPHSDKLETLDLPLCQPFRFLRSSSSGNTRKKGISSLRKGLAKTVGIAFLVLSLVVFARKTLVLPGFTTGLGRYESAVKDKALITTDSEVNIKSVVEPHISSLAPSPLSPSIYRAARNQATILARKYRSDVLDLSSSLLSTAIQKKPKSFLGLKKSMQKEEDSKRVSSVSDIPPKDINIKSNEMTNFFSIVPSESINTFHLQLSQGYSNISTFQVNAQRISWKNGSLQAESLSASLVPEDSSSRYTIQLKKEDCYGYILIYVWTDKVNYYGISLEYGNNPLRGRVIRVVCKQIIGGSSQDVESLSFWSYKPLSFLPAKGENYIGNMSQRKSTCTFAVAETVVTLFQTCMDKVKTLYTRASIWADQLFKTINTIYIPSSLTNVENIFSRWKKFGNYTALYLMSQDNHRLQELLYSFVNTNRTSIGGGNRTKEFWKNSYLSGGQKSDHLQNKESTIHDGSLFRNGRIMRRNSLSQAQKGAKRLLRSLNGTSVRNNGNIMQSLGKEWYKGSSTYLKNKRDPISKKYRVKLRNNVLASKQYFRGQKDRIPLRYSTSSGMNKLRRAKKTAMSTWHGQRQGNTNNILAKSYTHYMDNVKYKLRNQQRCHSRCFAKRNLRYPWSYRGKKCKRSSCF